MNTKYKLKILTDSYTGNFERELTGYVFGFWSEYDDCWKKFQEDLGEDLKIPVELFYDEHGYTCCEIDPENSNNLIVYFTDNPLKYIGLIRSRLKSFSDYFVQQSEYNRPIKILDLYLISVEYKETLIGLGIEK